MKKKIQNKYEHVNTSDLIPYARNARMHSEKQINQIASSIKEFGFINPVIIDKDNGIIAGHGRVMAANKLKLEQCPCLRVEHLSETQKKAYILADNRLAETSSWDEELLKIELEELKEMNFDFNTIGFDEFKFDEFIPNIREPSESNSENANYKLIVIFDSEDEMQMLFDELNTREYKIKVG